jgi:hypothetical protein
MQAAKHERQRDEAGKVPARKARTSCESRAAGAAGAAPRRSARRRRPVPAPGPSMACLSARLQASQTRRPPAVRRPAPPARRVSPRRGRDRGAAERRTIRRRTRRQVTGGRQTCAASYRAATARPDPDTGQSPLLFSASRQKRVRLHGAPVCPRALET